MKEQLDLIKILKDCPKGTKFYSRCLGSVEFCKITLDNYIEVIGKNGYYIGFKPNGTYQHSEESAEIDLFPSKDQRDWSKWHRPFVNGDIVFYNDTIAIFKEWGDETLFRTYVAKGLNCEDLIGINTPLFGKSVRNEIRFATEEEKQILFDAIKEYGYKWNEETKTLENLIKSKEDTEDKTVMSGIYFDREYYADEVELHLNNYEIEIRDGKTYAIFKNQETKISKPKFKEGDIVISAFGDIHLLRTEDSSYCAYRHKRKNKLDNIITTNITVVRLATEEEKEKLFKAIKENGYKWNPETKTLEKLIVPKFKIGDSIQSKFENNVKFTITNIDNNKFYYGCGNGHEFMIPVVKQDNWELVPNKTTKDMGEKKINQMLLANCDLDEVEIVLGDRFELKIKDNKYYAVRKKLTYPTTYAECCKVIGYGGIISFAGLADEEEKLYGKFIALKRCRDAYWKIAGEYLELDKPWEPDWTNENQPKYGLYDELKYSIINPSQFVFPTEEMREYFYKNFKNLIEQCKELL